VESGLVEFAVDAVRAIGCDVQHVPVRDPIENYAHAQLTRYLSGEQADDLLEASSVRVRPTFPGYDQ